MIKNIVFDIGMVLVDFRYKAFMKDLGFEEKVIEYLADNMIHHPDWNKYDLGMEEKEFVKAQKERMPEYAEYIDKIFEDYTDIVRSYPYSKEWLEGLKSRGYNIYLLSNYPVELFNNNWKNCFSFTDSVDGKIVSGFVKVSKPSKEIYELLLNTYNLKAEECVFIDDRAENIEAAVENGFNGIVFDSYENVNQKLKKLLVTE